MAPHQNNFNGFDGRSESTPEMEPAAAAAGRAGRGHPLLTTWNPPSTHSFSKTQMRSLASICDAFSPSIDAGADDSSRDCDSSPARESLPGKQESLGGGYGGRDDLAAFYRCSASDMNIPQDIAGLLSVLLNPTLLAAIKAILWLLSTRLGTVILGGRASFTSQFPFCESFPALARPKQETILRRWSLSFFGSLRAVFKLFKMITLWAVYTKIERDGHNRNWKAMGYCGADPEIRSRDRAVHDPLKDVVIAAQSGGENLRKALHCAGFALPEDLDGLKKLTKGRRRAQNSAEGDDVGIRCDVVVVGSGGGGGVAAAVLAKAGLKVLVLEKGKYFTASDFSTLEGPSQMAMFEKLGSLATDDGGVNLVAGATVGGGTTINWSVCFETPAHVLRGWAETSGLDLFTSARYQLAMREVWQRLGARVSGDAQVRENMQNAVLREGCERLGVEVGMLARNNTTDGSHECGWCTSGCARGEKGSTSLTWLADAAQSGNALVLAECEAEAILYSANDRGRKLHKARGVVARVGTTEQKLFVEARAVVVASGSLMTPPLLLNSGLRNPNIGKGLHLHPVVFVWGYFPHGTGPPGTCYEGAIMTSYSPIYKTGSRVPSALLEVPSTHPGSFASFQPWTSAADFKERMARYSRTVTLCVVTRDESSGEVSVDGDGTPVITYSMNAADEATTLQGIETGLRVLIAAGATEVGTHQQDGERFSLRGASAADIEAYIRRVKARGIKKNRIAMGSGHQMSTCRMGSDPEQSVVDGGGESWEVERLYVSDGSVLPSAVGVNPMVTIQTLAYCIAHSLLQSLQNQS